MSHAELDAALDDLCATAVMVEVSELPSVVPKDPDDDKFFECAVAGGATYIISGDAQVLAVGEYRGIHVLAATLFLHLLEQGVS